MNADQAVWNESFIFHLVDLTQTFDFAVRAPNLFSKRTVGRTEQVELGELLAGNGNQEPKQLTIKSAQGGYVGVIHI